MGGQRIFIYIIANIILKIKRQIKGKIIEMKSNCRANFMLKYVQ